MFGLAYFYHEKAYAQDENEARNGTTSQGVQTCMYTHTHVRYRSQLPTQTNRNLR